MSSDSDPPGVYIDEYLPRPPISGVGTATAAFIGPAAKGPAEPTRITSFVGFQELYGDQQLPGRYLSNAVRSFFSNGGNICYIVNSAAEGDAKPSRRPVRTVDPGAPRVTFDSLNSALDRLTEIDDVNQIAIPDAAATPFAIEVAQAMIEHCERMRDRFAVLDPPPELQPFGADGVEGWRARLTSPRGYGALYYPWLRVGRGQDAALAAVPPSGHVCGVYARVDGQRGVFKAPANVYVYDARDVGRRVTESEHGRLNQQGVSVIRDFAPYGRPKIYGARTIATEPAWRYVNVRRLLIFLETSIRNGIAWAGQEESTPELWESLRRRITDFLRQQWQEGALFGQGVREAFYVRADEALNPPGERAAGRVHVEVGVRAAYSDPFIVFRVAAL